MSTEEYVAPSAQTKALTGSWSLVTTVRRGFAGLKHSYGGTVPVEVVARRRAANRLARVSRRKNRGK